MADTLSRLRRASREAAALPDSDPDQPVTRCRLGAVPGRGPLEPDPARPRSWIAVRVEDVDGALLAGELVEIELEGGQILRGRTGDDGELRFDEVEEDQGTARVPDAGSQPAGGGDG